MNLLNYNMCEGVRAFTTTRKGGVGQGAYSTFSITPYSGDNLRHVALNRQLLCKELQITDKQLVLPIQTHSTNVQVITDSAELKSEDLENVDALITNVKRLCIGVSTADCVPILLCEKHKRCVAAIHSGWRGTVANIVKATVNRMTSHFCIKAEDILAIIGPSISVDNFEVGREVYDAFALAGFNMQEISKLCPASDGFKWHIDLWRSVAIQLEQCGVPASQIQVAGICTYKCCDDYFSARRLGIHSGRIFSGVMLE